MLKEKQLLEYFGQLSEVEQEVIFGKIKEMLQNRTKQSEEKVEIEMNGIVVRISECVNCVLSEANREKSQEEKNEKYYEGLIHGIIPAKTGYEKAIQCTKKDAGLVLAMIGVDHPASKIVHKYLAKQKYEETKRWSYLLCRHFIK